MQTWYKLCFVFVLGTDPFRIENKSLILFNTFFDDINFLRLLLLISVKSVSNQLICFSDFKFARNSCKNNLISPTNWIVVDIRVVAHLIKSIFPRN